MLSAIAAVTGSDTGNLLMQYPRTTVSTDASTESGRVALRVYMGAVLKRPDNVLVMHDVACSNIDDVDATTEVLTLDTTITNVMTDDSSAPGDADTYFDNINKAIASVRNGTSATDKKFGKYDDVIVVPASHTATTEDMAQKNGWKPNTSYLGKLDHPNNVHALMGGQVFADLQATPRA